MSDKTDFENFKNFFHNPEFVSSKGYNYLQFFTLFQAEYYKSLTEIVKTRFMNRFIEIINLGYELDCVNPNGLTPLLQCLELNNFILFKELVTNKICDINKYFANKGENVNIFKFLIQKKNIDLIEFAIKNDVIINFKSDIYPITDKDFKTAICKLIILTANLSEDILSEECLSFTESTDNFRVFDFSDFNILSVSGKGTYGQVSIVREKKSNQLCVIKKFEIKNEDPNNFFSDDAIKDIICLKTLQKLPHTCNVYGIIIHNNDKYMVLEKLRYTITDFIYILRNCREDKYKNDIYVKWLLKSILECINENSKAGIIHYDIKGENMMISSSGKVKLIDYGLSIFAGLNRNKDLLTNNPYTSPYMSDDGGNSDYTIKSTSGGPDIIYSHGNISYQKDIPSVAMIFLNNIGLSNLPFSHFFSHNGVIYKHPNVINSKNKYVKNNLLYDNLSTATLIELRMLYTDDFISYLTQCLEISPLRRRNAKELLHLMYNKPLLIPNIDLCNINNKDIKLNIVKNANCYKIVYSGLDYISTRLLSNGFVYIDDNINFYSNNVLKPVSNTLTDIFTENLISQCVNIINLDPCIDTLFNFLAFSIENKDFFTDDKYIILSSYSYCLFFNFYAPEIKTLIRGNPLKIKDTINNLNSISTFFYSNNNVYELRSITIFINYIKLILQMVTTNITFINTVIYKLSIDILYYTIFHHSGINMKFKIFDLIKYFYNSRFSHMLELNLEVPVNLIAILDTKQKFDDNTTLTENETLFKTVFGL